jgi:uncharacterized protein YndB with AHSA1/START domain
MAEIVVDGSVWVPNEPAAAFALFTERMSDWWPIEHSIGSAPRVAVVLEPHEGGRWYERGADGSECQWGQVARWAPPGLLVLLWQIGASWKFDPEMRTEVEISFTEDPSGGTTVALRHRHLERYGEQAEVMRAAFDSRDGWPGMLARFADLAG